METTTNQSLVIHLLCLQPGADPDFVGPEVCTIFWVLFNENNTTFRIKYWERK